jgi:hypothetical protein
MAFTNSMEKKIMNIKDMAKKRNKKSMLFQAIKKGNRLAKKGTITKALGCNISSFGFSCWDPPNLVH